jgi:hypothetical protein
MKSLDGEPDFDKKKNKQSPRNMRQYQKALKQNPNPYRYPNEIL